MATYKINEKELTKKQAEEISNQGGNVVKLQNGKYHEFRSTRHLFATHIIVPLSKMDDNMIVSGVVVESQADELDEFFSIGNEETLFLVAL